MFSNRLRSSALMFTAAATIASASALTAGSTGCSAPDDDGFVHGRAEIINQARSALSDADVAAMTLAGTYGGNCDGHTGDGSDVWTSADLAVRKNDSNCVLTITGIVVGGTTYATGGTNIVLDTENAFENAALAYKVSGSGNMMFRGNAKISSLGFASNFTITLLTSDDSTTADAGTRSAGYAMHTETLEASNVSPPTYSASFTDLIISKDANNVVPTGGVSGFAQLTPGGSADRFKVVEGAVDASSFSTVDTAFAGGELLSGLTSNQLPAAQFAALEGDDLTNGQVWSIILRNLDSASNVYSYQIIYVTFTP